MKHQVLSSDALSKFVVIASASRGAETSESNMMRTAQALAEVAGLGRAVKGVELVTGFYAKQGKKGAYEQSMAIAVDAPKALKALVSLFCQKYSQECVLVWNKDTNSVWRLNTKGFVAELGTKGLVITHHSWNMAQVLGHKLPDAFIVAADGYVWEVC